MEGAHRRGLWGVPGTVIYPVVFFFVFAGGGAFQQFYIRAVTHSTDISIEHAGTLLATLYFSYAISRFLVGRLTYAVGEYAVFVVATITYALFPASLLVTKNYWVLLSFCVLMGAGAPFIHTVAPSLMLDAGDVRNRRGRSVGTLYFWLGVGFTLGVLAYAVIEGAQGAGALRQRYRIIAALAAGLTVAGILAATAGPRNMPRRDFPTVASFVDVMRIKGAPTLSFILFGSAISFGLMLSVFYDKISTSATMSVAGMIAFYGMRTSMTYLSGRLSDHVGVRRSTIMGASYFIAGAGLLAAALLDQSWAWLVAAAALGIQAGTCIVIPQAIVGDWATSGKRHIAFTSIFVWSTLGMALTIFSATWLRKAFGDSVWNWIVFALLLIVLGVSSLTIERPGATTRRSTQ